MGTFISATIGAVLGWIMRGKIDGPQTQRHMPLISSDTFSNPSNSAGGPECMGVIHREDDECDSVVIDSISGHVHATNSNTEKQKERCTHQPNCKVSNERSDAIRKLSRVKNAFTASRTELQNCEGKVQKLRHDLDEKANLIERLKSSEQAKTVEMHVKTVELGKKLRLVTEASDKEVQLLKSNIEEKEKVVEDIKSERSQLMTKCQKLEAQLTLIEQKRAQESLTSGSYADDRANPGMLEAACKGVDKATEALAKFLHDNSITSRHQHNSEYLEQFVGTISLAHPAEFSRAIQVKYAWGHWICLAMFHCFEHVYFNADDFSPMTSPLDSKNHALKCYGSFQQMKDISPSDLYEGCDMFRGFCTGKYRKMFPQWLVVQAFSHNSPGDIVFDNCGRFSGDGAIFNRFLDVAKAVWLLHELAFSFDPPASILRMCRGTPYEKQFHESVIPDEDSNGIFQIVVLMSTRPAFRVRNAIVRSRVFLSKKPA